MSTTAARPSAPSRATVLAGAVGLFAGVALTLAGSAIVGRSSSPDVARAVVDSVDTQTGLVCLRRAEGDAVDCYPSSVPGLRAGTTIDYALTTATVDPSQDGGGGTQQVITWAVPATR